MKETDIQNSICEYLELKGYFFWRQNNAPVFDKERAIVRRMPKFAMKGIPDIILIQGGLFIGLEVKTEKTKQSESQLIFEENCLKNGGKYHVVRSIDDVQALGL